MRALFSYMCVSCQCQIQGGALKFRHGFSKKTIMKPLLAISNHVADMFLVIRRELFLEVGNAAHTQISFLSNILKVLVNYVSNKPYDLKRSSKQPLCQVFVN